MRALSLAVLLVFFQLVSCQTVFRTPLVFSGSFSGANAVPQNPGGTLGSVVIRYDYDKKELTFWLTSPVLAEIDKIQMYGPAGLNQVSSQVVFDFSPNATKIPAKGKVSKGAQHFKVDPDLLLSYMSVSAVYALFVVDGFRYRANLTPVSDSPYNVQMTGAEMIPPVVTTGFAYGFVGFNVVGKFIYWRIFHTLLTDVQSLTLEAPAGFLQQGPAIQLDLVAKSPSGAILENPIEGIEFFEDDADVSATELYMWLRNGLAYLQMNTAVYPNGEVRGSLFDRIRATFSASAQEANVYPAQIGVSGGSILLYHDPNKQQMEWVARPTGTYPTSASIHAPAVSGAVAPALLTLWHSGPVPEQINGYSSPPLEIESLSVSYGLLEFYLYSGLAYLEYNGGDIVTRGQFTLSSAFRFVFVMSGLSVIPAVFTAASASVVAEYNDIFTYQITHSVIGADRAWIAGPALLFTNADIIYYLAPNGTQLPNIMHGGVPFPSSYWNLTKVPAPGRSLVNSEFYMVIGSPNYPNGEIRGQFLRDDKSFGASASVIPTIPPTPKP